MTFFISARLTHAATFVHPSGSVVISQGTIYRISDNGQALEGFDTPEKYFSYRFSFAQAATATPDDLALPRTVISWGEGRLFVDNGVGYQISGGTKHGFVSQDAFLGQGFKFSQAKVGTLNLPTGNNIGAASEAHLSGTFVIDKGTVWFMTDTSRIGVPSIAHLSSYGLNFSEVVPANANDMAKPAESSLAAFRSGSLINDGGNIWVIEGNGKKSFPSSSCFTNFGFSFANALKASTAGYQDNGTICGPIPTAPPVSYERRTVATSRGNFTVDILTADLSSGGVEVVTDTANDTDCLDNCSVKSLLDYVNENQGFAGIHGTYFCPQDYPECAGKVNTFYWKVYNSQLEKMINPNNHIKEDKPFMAFDANGVHFFSQYKDFVSANLPITAGISNEPLLIQNGQIVVTEAMLDDKQRTVDSNRGGLGVKGQTLYAVVARSATVFDLAFIMQAIGAENAFNLDGGGTAAMVFEGVYKAGPGRAMPNALVFVRK